MENMIKTEGFPNIRIKAEKFGFTIPDSVWILPTGFENMKEPNNIVYNADYDTVIKLFKTKNIPCSTLDTKFAKLQNNSFELFSLPLIVFPYHFLINHPEIIIESVKWFAELFHKHSKSFTKNESPEVKVTIIKEERPSSFKKYSYQGPESSFNKFIEFVEREEKNGKQRNN